MDAVIHVKIRYSIEVPTNYITHLPLDIHEWLLENIGEFNVDWALFCREANDMDIINVSETIMVGILPKFKNKAAEFKLRFGGL